MIVYNTPMGNRARLSVLRSLVESGISPNWSYASPAAGVAQNLRTGVFPGSLIANENGSIAVKVTSATIVSLAFHKSATPPTDGTDFDWRIVNNGIGNNYQAVKPGTAMPTTTPAQVGDIMQMRRNGTNVIAEVSRDEGVTWIVLMTWTGVPATQVLFGMLYLAVDSSVGALYTKNLKLETAFDTFKDLTIGTSLQGRTWSSGSMVWPANANVRLKADGNGFVNRDLSLNDSKTVAQYPMRDGDVGLAVAFKHINTDETLTPILRILSDETGVGGVTLKLAAGQLVAQEDTGTATEGVLVSLPADAIVGQEYCLEIVLTSDVSGKMYNFRLMRAPDGSRTSLVAQGTLTASAAAIGYYASIEGVTVSSELDPIQRVETLSRVFVINARGVAGFPSDDGTTVTSLIGTAVDCHFPDPLSWWNWMVVNLVKQKRKYVGLFDKTTEFVFDTLTLSGKITSAQYDVVMKPRPGHAWYEHADFLTGPLRYNKARGVAFAFNNQYSDKFYVNNDYVTIEGFQIKFNFATWGTGTLVYINATNSPLRLNFIDTNALAGRWVVGVKTFGDNHFGNIIWVQNSLEFAVHHDLQGGTWENNTIVAASDTTIVADNCRALTSKLGTHRNNAYFGFSSNYLAFYGENLNFINCATDRPAASAFSTSTGIKENNLTGLVVTDQFYNTTKAGCDLRVKEGSAFYNAGAIPHILNTRSINGARVKEGVADIGAWEAPRRLPSKSVITGKVTNTAGYTTTIRVALNQALVEGETQVISMSDAADGTFDPAAFTLTNTKTYQDVVYASVGDLGPRSIVAHGDSGNYVLQDATFAMEVVAPEPATKLVVANVTAGKVGEPVTFNLSTDNPLFAEDAVVYTLTADVPGTFTPSTATLSRNNLSDDILFVPLDSGAVNIQITSTGNLALPTLAVPVTVAPLPPTYGAGENRYYVGPGRMFETMAACLTYVNGRNLVLDQASVFIHVAGNVVAKGSLSVNQNSVYFVTILPAVGKGYRAKAVVGKYHYPDDGAQITVEGGDFRLSSGTQVKELRLRFADGSRLIYVGVRPGDGFNNLNHLVDNRVLVERLGTGMVIGCGEFGSSLNLINNAFVVTQPGEFINLQDGAGAITGNTVIARGSAVGNAVIGFGYYSGANSQQLIQNNVFIDSGSWPMRFLNPDTLRYDVKYFNSNYTNTALAGALDVILPIGMVINTVAAFVLDKANDLRPADNSPLLGNGSSLAASTNDGAGSNRGFEPDVGAFQRTPATTLPIVRATKQEIKGQQLVLGVSLLNTIDDLKVTLTGDGDGAASQGPLPVTYNATTGEITLSNLAPGKYKGPVFTAVNNGGSTASTGFLPFVISAIVLNATFDDFIGVADTILAQGRPLLPFRGDVTGPVVDVLPPRINLIANRTNFIEASTLVLTAEVSDDTGIDRVEFYRDAVLVATRSATPWTYSQQMNDASSATSNFSAKAFDITGKSTASQAILVYANVPTAGLSAPTVVSVEAVNPNHVIVEFSRAMNKAPDFDFAGSGSYALGDHMVTNSSWVDGSDTKVRLGVDGYWEMRAGEILTLTYIQNKQRGWRTADGVLVESFLDLPVVNNIAVTLSEPLQHDLTSLAANTPLAGSTWSRGSAVWNATTKFVSNGTGGVVPDTGSPVIAGIVRMGQFFNDGYFFQQGLAVFFKLTTSGDSPYGIIMRSDTDNTKLGKGLRVWVTNDGNVRFNHDPQHNTVPVVLPDIKTPALIVGQEYCLELQQVSVSGFMMYEYRLSLSVNKVRSTTLASARFHTTENSGSGDVKVYAVNPAVPAGVVTHFEGPTGHFGAPDIWPTVTLPNRARLTKLSNIVEDATATPDYTYSGNGTSLSATPGGVFDLVFANRPNASNGVQVTLTNQVDNIHIGAIYHTAPNVVGDLLPANRMLLAIRASAIGRKYEVLVNGKLRAAQKQVTIAPGDVIRVRAMGTMLFAEVKKDTATWIKLGFVRSCMSDSGGNTMMCSQLLLPGNSSIVLPKY